MLEIKKLPGRERSTVRSVKTPQKENNPHPLKIRKPRLQTKLKTISQ